MIGTVKKTHKKKTYVTVKNAATGKSKATTVYGMAPDEVLRALEIGVEAINKEHAANAA